MLKRLAAAALALALLVLAAHGARVLTGASETLAAWVPDDAFYYAKIAHHFALTGVPSADEGLTLTSGYHVLWMWLLALGARVFGLGVVGTLRWAIGLSLALATAAAATAIRFLRARDSENGASGECALALLVTSFAALNGAASGMEWSLAVALSAAYWWSIDRAHDGAGACFAAAAIGFFGSLARTDFVGVPVALLFAAALAAKLRRRPGRLRLHLSGLAGAGAGVIAAGLTYEVTSGSFFQASARIKASWSAAAPFNPVVVAHQFLRAALYVPGLPNIGNKIALKLWLSRIVFYAAAVAVVPVFLFRRRIAQRAREAFAAVALSDANLQAVLASASILTGYLCAYATVSLGVQFWYTAHVVVPVFVLARLAIARFAAQRLTLALAAANLCTFALCPAPWLDHLSALDTARTLGQRLPGVRVGVSDSGLISAFSRAAVINTDGLVNDEIALYLPAALHCYLADKKIAWLTGFGTTELAFEPPYETFAVRELVGGELLWHARLDAIRALPECGVNRLGPAAR